MLSPFPSSRRAASARSTIWSRAFATAMRARSLRLRSSISATTRWAKRRPIWRRPVSPSGSNRNSLCQNGSLPTRACGETTQAEGDNCARERRPAECFRLGAREAWLSKGIGGKMSDREIELKLVCEPAELERVRRAPVLQRMKQGRASGKHLHSVYFDTDNLVLGDNGMALRLRRHGRGCVQTLKTEA